MSLRGSPIVEEASLPDGRVLVVVPDDPYIPKRELDTVALELIEDGQVAASVNTVLGVEHESEARRLARDVAAGLAAGELQPTAGALEPLADSIP